MTNANFHTVVFQPIGYDRHNIPALGNSNIQLAPIRTQVTNKMNELFIKAIAYIQAIIRLLRSSSPFFEQYGPILQELPKMYKIMKVFNDLKDENIEDLRQEQKSTTYDIPSPTLFI